MPRPRSVTLLAVVIAGIAGINALGVVTAIRRYTVLRELPLSVSPAYLVLSSAVWAVVFTALALGLWRCKHWARLGTPLAWTLYVAAANLGIKECLYHYSRRVGRRSGSTAIAAAAWDHRADALCSLVVLVGLLAAIFGGAQWAMADDIAALGIAALIMLSGLRLFRDSSHELLDAQADPILVDNVRQVAEQVAGVRGIETLLVRKSGIEFFADIHIEVDGHLTVAEGHRIGHDVKDALLDEFLNMRDVLVHIEPYPHEHYHHPTGRDS